ncbi:putative aminoacrylate hydrolase RutD [Halomonadaceae bacterium LMG 33818]|uniref:alpha/beta fold hydrolase n=1 Tax=Cernens ardua TaxID=3402176 RepID=UPI003EDBBDC3
MIPISNETLNPAHIQNEEARHIHETHNDNQDTQSGQLLTTPGGMAVNDRANESVASVDIKVLSGWAMPTRILAPFAQTLRQCGEQFNKGEFRVEEWDIQTLIASAISLTHEPRKENSSEITNSLTCNTCTGVEQILEYAAAVLGLTESNQGDKITGSDGPKERWLVGWSLGGMLAVALAHRYPAMVTGVVTLGANACFSTQIDWPNAMPRATFEQFYQRFQRSPQRTLKRFAFLCTSLNTEPRVNHDHAAKNNNNHNNDSNDIGMGSTQSDGESKPQDRVVDQDTSTSAKQPESLSSLEVSIKPGQTPQESARLLEESMLASLDTSSTHSALLKGLDLLGQLDNRDALVGMKCPQFHLFAGGDMLVPVSAAEDIKALIRLNHYAECAVVQGAHSFPMNTAEESASVVLHFIRHRSIQQFCTQHHSNQHHNIHLKSLCAQ